MKVLRRQISVVEENLKQTICSTNKLNASL